MLIDDITKLIAVAKSLKERVNSNAAKVEEVLALLDLLKKIDLHQQYSVNTAQLPSSLERKTKLIFLLADRAHREVETKHYVPGNVGSIIQQIIDLEGEVQKDIVVLPILPSTVLRRVLSYGPADAFSRGYLFRGVSEEDYARVMQGDSLFASNPHGHARLLDHILDPTNTPNTQFISLTSDPLKAGHFGKVLVIQRNRLQGHLYTPAEIEAILRRESGGKDWSKAKRLQRKNTEFILGPSGSDVACIPSFSVVRRAA